MYYLPTVHNSYLPTSFLVLLPRVFLSLSLSLSALKLLTTVEESTPAIQTSAVIFCTCINHVCSDAAVWSFIIRSDLVGGREKDTNSKMDVDKLNTTLTMKKINTLPDTLQDWHSSNRNFLLFLRKRTVGSGKPSTIHVMDTTSPTSRQVWELTKDTTSAGTVQWEKEQKRQRKDQ